MDALMTRWHSRVLAKNTYIDPKWVLSKEFILNIVVIHRIGIKSTEALFFKTFLEICHPPGGKAKVNHEYCQDQGFGIWLVQPVSNGIAKENHQSIFLVVFGIKRVFLVDPAAAEHIV